MRRLLSLAPALARPVSRRSSNAGRQSAAARAGFWRLHRCFSSADGDASSVTPICALFAASAASISGAGEGREAPHALPAASLPSPPPPRRSVTIAGWLRSARKQKRYTFLEVSDGSCARSLQVVWSAADAERVLGEGAGAAERQLSVGAAVRIEGAVVASPRAEQPIELQARSVRVVGGCDADAYPLQRKAHTAEFMRDIAHLRARSGAAGSMLRVRSAAALAVHAFFAREGFVNVHTPVLTSNDCEGAGELFAVHTSPPLVAAADAGAAVSAAGSAAATAPAAPLAAAASSGGFFGKPVYLTVSGQLHLEAFACALSRVYAFGPTFRAENSNTARHLAEFWMIEPEMAPGGLDDAMALAERCVRATLAALLETGGGDLANCAAGAAAAAAAGGAAGVDVVARSAAVAHAPAPFARMRYGEAVAVLAAAAASGAARFAHPVDWAAGLATEHERYLAETHVRGPLFVTDYPAAIKPFYMRGNDADGGATVASFDLLLPGIGELIGGSAREERWEVLARKMRARRLLSPRFADAVDAAARGGGEGGGSESGGAAAAPRAGGTRDAAALSAASAAAAAGLPVADLDNMALDWYLDLRRFGSVPHAGWGMGFERLLLYATGIDNIRDVIPIPRIPGSCRM